MTSRDLKYLELLYKKLTANKKNVVVVETYHGVYDDEIISEVKKGLQPTLFINAKDAMLSENEIKELVYPDVTDDRIFGFLTRLQIEAFFNPILTTILKKISLKSFLIRNYNAFSSFLQN